MANHDIQKSQQLLKRLEEEMTFLGSLLEQALFVASGLKKTWAGIGKVHKRCVKGLEKGSKKA